MKNLLNKILNTIYDIRNTIYEIVIVILSLVIVATATAFAAQYFFVVEFTTFKDGTAVFNSVKLLQGDELILSESNTGYSFKIRDLERNIIAQKTFNFDFKSEVDSDKGYIPVDIDRIDGFTRIPYSQNAETLELTDPEGKILAQAYLKDYICKDDGLCPAICRGTNDNDCKAQGRCGDGMCQTRYENEKTCALDCLIRDEPTTSIDNNEIQEPADNFRRTRDLNGFIIFLATFIIVAFGAYAYLRYRRYHKT